MRVNLPRSVPVRGGDLTLGLRAGFPRGQVRLIPLSVLGLRRRPVGEPQTGSSDLPLCQAGGRLHPEERKRGTELRRLPW